MSEKVSYGSNSCASDSIDIGLRAGLEASNLEFNRVWITPRQFQWEGQTHLLPLGAKLVNAKGEIFMDKYSPVFGTNTDPHFVSRGMAIEALLGNGPFYMDCSGMAPESVEMITPKGDEWMAHQRSLVGGIEADVEGRTNVRGLFASCRSRTTDPSLYSGGFSLCLCQVLGSITGRCAGEFAKAQEQLSLDPSEIKEFKGQPFESVGRDDVRGPRGGEILWRDIMRGNCRLSTQFHKYGDVFDRDGNV